MCIAWICAWGAGCGVCPVHRLPCCQSPKRGHVPVQEALHSKRRCWRASVAPELLPRLLLGGRVLLVQSHLPWECRAWLTLRVPHPSQSTGSHLLWPWQRPTPPQVLSRIFASLFLAFCFPACHWMQHSWSSPSHVPWLPLSLIPLCLLLSLCWFLSLLLHEARGPRAAHRPSARRGPPLTL